MLVDANPVRSVNFPAPSIVANTVTVFATVPRPSLDDDFRATLALYEYLVPSTDNSFTLVPPTKELRLAASM